jgi:hypothetical protein
MEPNQFAAEVIVGCRSEMLLTERPPASRKLLMIRESYFQFLNMNPCSPLIKDAAIVGIGFGGGWFIAACLKLGYTNISGAEFGMPAKCISASGRTTL